MRGDPGLPRGEVLGGLDDGHSQGGRECARAAPALAADQVQRLARGDETVRVELGAPVGIPEWRQPRQDAVVAQEADHLEGCSVHAVALLWGQVRDHLKCLGRDGVLAGDEVAQGLAVVRVCQPPVDRGDRLVPLRGREQEGGDQVLRGTVEVGVALRRGVPGGGREQRCQLVCLRHVRDVAERVPPPPRLFADEVLRVVDPDGP